MGLTDQNMEFLLNTHSVSFDGCPELPIVTYSDKHIGLMAAKDGGV
jgi:hypothetical protein